jgi:hypothetical protein
MSADDVLAQRRLQIRTLSEAKPTGAPGNPVWIGEAWGLVCNCSGNNSLQRNLVVGKDPGNLKIVINQEL